MTSLSSYNYFELSSLDLILDPMKKQLPIGSMHHRGLQDGQEVGTLASKLSSLGWTFIGHPAC